MFMFSAYVTWNFVLLISNKRYLKAWFWMNYIFHNTIKFDTMSLIMTLKELYLCLLNSPISLALGQILFIVYSSD